MKTFKLLAGLLIASLFAFSSYGQLNGNFNTVRLKQGNDPSTFSPQPNGTILLAQDSSLYLRTASKWAKFVFGSGGPGFPFNNTASAGQLIKSAGLNGVNSGLFPMGTADLYLGTGLSGALRTIQADGSSSNVDLNIQSKGASQIGFGDISTINWVLINGGTPSFRGLTTATIIEGSTGSPPIATGNLTLQTKVPASGNTDSGAINVQSGIPAGNGSSGNIIIQTGTPSGSGARGSVIMQLPRNRQTISYQLVIADNFAMVEMNAAGATVLTVPANATVTFPVDQTQIMIMRRGAGTVTITPAVGVTINSAAGAVTIGAQYASATLIKIATNEWYLIGNLL